MKILVVSQNYYPDNFRINDITAELVKKGHKVTVLTGLPDYTTGKIPEEYHFFRKRKEIIQGVRIYRVPTIARRRGAIFRGLNYFSFAFTGFVFCLFHKFECDVIYVYEPSPITMLYPALYLKKRYLKKVLLYCLDLWPESVKIFGIKEKSFLYKAIAKISRYLYQGCDQIAVSSKPFFKYLHQVNDIPYDKMCYLPQHAEDIYLDMNLQAIDNHCTDFVFTGNIGKAQDIECIIEAVEIIRGTPDFMVHLVGDGSHLESCKQMIKEKHLEDKFVLHGRHPIDQMPEFYRLADACLLTLKCDNFVGMTMPSKLQSYMAAGKPVIGAITGAAQEVIKESNCGLCVDASDAKGLAEMMKVFIQNPNAYKNCGENGRCYFKKNFTKAIFMDHLEELLSNLAKEESHVQR